jgi:hypothetical protein
VRTPFWEIWLIEPEFIFLDAIHTNVEMSEWGSYY